MSRSRDSSLSKTLLKIVSWLLLGAATIFAFSRIFSHLHAFDELLLRPRVLVMLCAGSLVYACILFLITFAWRLFLNAVSSKHFDISLVFSIYGRSQIAKYLPGNVFHYAGRHTLGAAHGLPQVAMLVATFLETVICAIAATALMLGLGWYLGDLVNQSVPAGLIITGSVVAGGLSWFLLAKVSRLPVLSRWVEVRNLPDLAWRAEMPIGFFLYVAFFLSCAMLLWLFDTLLAGAPRSGIFLPITLAFTSGWLIGTFTPGAPGGLGVREATMILLLDPVMPQAESVALAIGFRVLTTLGELNYFLAASFVTAKLIDTRAR